MTLCEGIIYSDQVSKVYYLSSKVKSFLINVISRIFNQNTTQGNYAMVFQLLKRMSGSDSKDCKPNQKYFLGY